MVSCYTVFADIFQINFITVSYCVILKSTIHFEYSYLIFDIETLTMIIISTLKGIRIVVYSFFLVFLHTKLIFYSNTNVIYSHVCFLTIIKSRIIQFFLGING